MNTTGECNLNGNLCESSILTILNFKNFNNEEKLDSVKNISWNMIRGIGQMFYIISPEDTTFKELNQVPHFFRDVS